MPLNISAKFRVVSSGRGTAQALRPRRNSRRSTSRISASCSSRCRRLSSSFLLGSCNSDWTVPAAERKSRPSVLILRSPSRGRREQSKAATVVVRPSSVGRRDGGAPRVVRRAHGGDGSGGRGDPVQGPGGLQGARGGRVQAAVRAGPAPAGKSTLTRCFFLIDPASSLDTQARHGHYYSGSVSPSEKRRHL